MLLINDLHFLRPLWLIAIPLFYLFIFISYNKIFKIDNWENIVEPHLLKFLSTKTNNRKKNYLPWLLCFIVTLYLISLAGPVWEKTPQPIFKKKQARVVVLDLSYSMWANDLKPTRIDRVRFKLEDLLKSFNEGETALICYAGDAFIISPLTNDPATIISMLPSLTPDIMPVLGSNPDIAIKLAVDLIDRSKLNNGHIILVTDGIEEKLFSKIENVLESNNLSILAVGTESGSPVYLPNGELLKDEKGNIVIPKINKKSLKKFANSNNVNILFMSLDDKDLEEILSSESNSKNFTEDSKKRTTDKWEEEGPWLLLIAIPLSSLLFRRGIIFSVCFVILFSIFISPKSLQALEWKDLWLRDDQQAEKLFLEGKIEKALKKFKNQEWKGVAAYRSGDFEKAIENFSKSKNSLSTFNLANSYAMSGNLNKSLEIYEKLLKKFPNHKDAKYNKDLIEKLIEKQKIEKNSKKQREKNEENNFSGKRSQNKEKGFLNNDKDKKKDSKNLNKISQKNDEKTKNINEKENPSLKDKIKNSKNNLKTNDEKKDLKKNDAKKEFSNSKNIDNSKNFKNQVLEQWLRKIPDDPGRLIRNKMKFESQRRNRQNLGDNKYW